MQIVLRDTAFAKDLRAKVGILPMVKGSKNYMRSLNHPDLLFEVSARKRSSETAARNGNAILHVPKSAQSKPH